ncbi:MAG: sialidase family protein [Holophagaceae bacterium]
MRLALLPPACVLLLACGGGGGAAGRPAVEGGAAPVLVSGPAPRVVPLGGSWTFTAAATGDGLAYQWRKGGSAIPGAAASTYAFTPASLQDGGSLDVVVSNGAGSVTSPAVVVKVVPAQGPWTLDLKLSVGATPDAFGPPSTFVSQAGVASLAKRSNGQLVALFQWFPFSDPASFDQVAASFSSDGGRTWTAPKACTFTGIPAGYQRPFDPTVTVKEDGSLRVYFTSNVSGSATGFNSATSPDGLTWTFEPGSRFTPSRGTVDCAVARWNGQWHLVSPIGAPSEGAYHAVSDDGLTFTRLADIPSVGGVNWTGNLAVVYGALRFYGTPGSGLWFSATADGTTWSAPAGVGIQGGDPAVVEAEPGRWILVATGPPGS